MTWSLYQCKSRSPADHSRAQQRKPALPHIPPRCWFGSDGRSADPCLFMFVYLLSGSLNFSTRQLNPYRATSFNRSRFPALYRPPPARWQRGRLIRRSPRSRKRTLSGRFTVADQGGFDRFLFSSHRCFRLSLRVSAERKARRGMDVTCAHSTLKKKMM